MSPLIKTDIVIKGTTTYVNETILKYTLNYPIFHSTNNEKNTESLNRFYKLKTLQYLMHIQEDVISSAMKMCAYNKANDFPVHAYELYLIDKVTLNNSCVLSLYFDNYEYANGAHGTTYRYADTFYAATSKRISLDEVCSCKDYVINNVIHQANNDKKYIDVYNADALKENFNKENFYLTADNLVIFYPEITVAPYSSGIVEFLIPYDNCVVKPVCE